MREDNAPPSMLPGARRRQRGAAAIEFALLAAIFFTLVFGIIEVARLMYVYNTLQEVTRRAAAAAANVNPGDATALARLKQAAVFRTSAGGLALAPPVTDEHIRVNYLALTRAAGTNELRSVGARRMPSGDLADADPDHRLAGAAPQGHHDRRGRVARLCPGRASPSVKPGCRAHAMSVPCAAGAGRGLRAAFRASDDSMPRNGQPGPPG